MKTCPAVLLIPAGITDADLIIRFEQARAAGLGWSQRMTASELAQDFTGRWEGRNDYAYLHVPTGTVYRIGREVECDGHAPQLVLVGRAYGDGTCHLVQFILEGGEWSAR